MRVRTLVMGGGTAVLLTACGSGGAPPADVTRALQGDVAAVSAAARAGDGAAARAALTGLRAHVAAFQKDGRLSSARADRVLAAAGSLEPVLSAVAATPPPANRVSVAPSADPATPPPGKPKKRDEGDSHGD